MASRTAPLRTLVRRPLDRMRDPFGFAEALHDLALQPADLPGWSREARLEGHGH